MSAVHKCPPYKPRLRERRNVRPNINIKVRLAAVDPTAAAAVCYWYPHKIATRALKTAPIYYFRGDAPAVGGATSRLMLARMHAHFDAAVNIFAIKKAVFFHGICTMYINVTCMPAEWNMHYFNVNNYWYRYEKIYTT